jgi:hypothetical protein
MARGYKAKWNSQTKKTMELSTVFFCVPIADELFSSRRRVRHFLHTDFKDLPV